MGRAESEIRDQRKLSLFMSSHPSPIENCGRHLLTGAMIFPNLASDLQL